MSNERFFAIEGLDGVGKSTLVDRLRGKDFTVLSTPPDLFKKIRAVFEHTDVNLRFLYYLFGVMYVGKQARQAPTDHWVVSDRYLLTTLSAHEAMGMSQKWLSLLEPFIKTIEKPRITFLVTCNEDERIRRLLARGMNDLDEKNTKISNQIMSGYFKWSDTLGYQLIVVDTTNIPPEIAVQAIEKFRQ